MPKKYSTAYLTVEIILAFLLPPVAVAIHRGANKEVLIDVILWLIAWIPGTIYALYILFAKESKRARPPLYVERARHSSVVEQIPYSLPPQYETTTTTTTTETIEYDSQGMGYPVAPQYTKQFAYEPAYADRLRAY